MSREALLESLSAVMDNEADEFETRRVLAEVNKDPELRATWNRYVTARAVIRREPLSPKLDVAARVAAVLTAENAVAAPATAMVRRKGWSSVGRVAVAASVTLAVLAGVRVFNHSDVGTQGLAQRAPSQLNMPEPARSPAVLASFSEESAKATAENKTDKSGATEKQETPVQR